MLLSCLTSFAADDLEKGLTLTNPKFLRMLESSGFSINQVLGISVGAAKISNADLFSDPTAQIVKATIEADIEAFKKADKEAGVGTGYSKRLFDVKNLSTSRARFVLVGLVNRQDKEFKSPDTCGEMRLIYRLAYNVKVDDEDVSSRLPMTINVILHAKKSTDKTLTCAQIATRWLNMYSTGDLNNMEDETKIKAAVTALVSTDSFLDKTRYTKSFLKALEINLQVIRTPAVVRPDFGANSDYLLRHFKWIESKNSFEVDYLENQIDKERIAKSPELLFKLQKIIKENVKAINDGTYIFPQEFLTKKALSLAPSGLKRIENRPFSNLITRDMIDKMDIAWESLDRIKSTTGLLRRLNDLSCTGCHQTKSVAGFHFSGKDPQGKYPGNSAFMPASPHFYGDLPRRFTVLDNISKSQIANYARGFAERPDDQVALNKLNGSGLLNGWGSHCSITDDATFKNWTCAAGLVCDNVLTSTYDKHVGVCVSANDQEVGQPCEKGRITYDDPKNGKYTRDETLNLKDTDHFLCSPQSATPGASTGGFPAGSIRRKDCSNMSSVEVCGVLPAGKSGFNQCISGSKNFLKCLREYRADVGLRACDQYRTCRDDYICAESNTPGVGACLPPYFLFQFRVDGHPL